MVSSCYSLSIEDGVFIPWHLRLPLRSTYYFIAFLLLPSGEGLTPTTTLQLRRILPAQL